MWYCVLLDNAIDETVGNWNVLQLSLLLVTLGLLNVADNRKVMSAKAACVEDTVKIHHYKAV